MLVFFPKDILDFVKKKERHSRSLCCEAEGTHLPTIIVALTYIAKFAVVGVVREDAGGEEEDPGRWHHICKVFVPARLLL